MVEKGPKMHCKYAIVQAKDLGKLEYYLSENWQKDNSVWTPKPKIKEIKEITRTVI